MASPWVIGRWSSRRWVPNCSFSDRFDSGYFDFGFELNGQQPGIQIQDLNAVDDKDLSGIGRRRFWHRTAIFPRKLCLLKSQRAHLSLRKPDHKRFRKLLDWSIG